MGPLSASGTFTGHFGDSDISGNGTGPCDESTRAGVHFFDPDFNLVAKRFDIKLV